MYQDYSYILDGVRRVKESQEVKYAQKVICSYILDLYENTDMYVRETLMHTSNTEIDIETPDEVYELGISRIVAEYSHSDTINCWMYVDMDVLGVSLSTFVARLCDFANKYAIIKKVSVVDFKIDDRTYLKQGIQVYYKSWLYFNMPIFDVSSCQFKSPSNYFPLDFNRFYTLILRGYNFALLKNKWVVVHMENSACLNLVDYTKLSGSKLAFVFDLNIRFSNSELEDLSKLSDGIQLNILLPNVKNLFSKRQFGKNLTVHYANSDIYF